MVMAMNAVNVGGLSVSAAASRLLSLGNDRVKGRNSARLDVIKKNMDQVINGGRCLIRGILDFLLENLIL